MTSVEELSAAEAKLAELMLYVAQKLQADGPGGTTKLNKVLYFAEFSHMRAAGRPITGVAYQKLERGPAPRRLRPIRDWLIETEAAELVTDQYFGYPLHRLVPIRTANDDLFDPSELQIVDQIIEALWGMTSDQVSERSHEDAGWKMVEFGEDIPFETAYLAQKVVVTERARRHAAELAARLGIT